MNVFVLCVFGLFYSTQSASVPVTFNSKQKKIDTRDYKIYQDLRHLGEKLYGQPKKSSGVLVSKWTPQSKVFPEELSEYAEGDMLNPPLLARSVLRDTSTRWPDKVIPYEISPSIRGQDLKTIYDAIEDFHRLTCLKFQPRTSSDEDYVSITDDNTGCHSSIGKIGGPQVVNLQTPGCTYYKRTVIHELLHAVGFVHEQSRPDRDTYVKINFENIEPSMIEHFKKLNDDEVDNQEIGYDYQSVMHFSSEAFSKNGLPTIEAKMKGVTMLGQRDGFTELDLQKVRKMYHCTEKEMDGEETTTETVVEVTHPEPTSYPIIPYPGSQPNFPYPTIIVLPIIRPQWDEHSPQINTKNKMPMKSKTRT